MRFTRRKALASIGAVGIGGSAVFGSGAFTQVEADRNFDLAIAQDENALLSLEPTGNIDQVTVEDTDGGRGADDGVIAFDFSDFDDAAGINSQADTAFDNAFEIENQTSEPIAVWLPVADEELETDVTTQLYNSATRSTEVVVRDDASDDVVTNQDSGLGTGDDDFADLTFPPSLHKSWDEQDSVNDPSGSGAAEQSRAFGMTPGGAVGLESGASVEGGFRFLVVNPRDDLDDREAFLRLRAERLDELNEGNLPDQTDDWATTFRNVDAM